MEKKRIDLQWEWRGWKYEVLTCLVIVVCIAIQALMIASVYRANGLVSGGITGISILLEYAFNIPSWLVILLGNIPIMILGALYLNLRLIFYSIVATLLFSGIMAITPEFTLNISDPTLASLFAGAIVGVSSAPIIRMGASTGGFDVLSIIVNKKYSFQLGSINIAINLCIIGCLAFVKGLDAALLSILAMVACNLAYNNMLQGLNRTKTVFIITDHWDTIAPALLEQLNRGVTCIPARGGYTGKEKTVVYCIVRTVELSAVRRIVRERDPGAFLSIVDTREVLGRGFQPNN